MRFLASGPQQGTSERSAGEIAEAGPPRKRKALFTGTMADKARKNEAPSFRSDSGYMQGSEFGSRGYWSAASQRIPESSRETVRDVLEDRMAMEERKQQEFGVEEYVTRQC